MEQSDFRKLLASDANGNGGTGPASGSASSSAGPGSSGARSHMRAFGVVPKRSAAAVGGKGGGGGASELFQPRKIQKRDDGSQEKAKKQQQQRRTNPVTGEAYVDRAEQRRQGREHEFAEQEKLLQEFEEANEGLDKTQVSSRVWVGAPSVSHDTVELRS